MLVGTAAKEDFVKLAAAFQKHSLPYMKLGKLEKLVRQPFICIKRMRSQNFSRKKVLIILGKGKEKA